MLPSSVRCLSRAVQQVRTYSSLTTPLPGVPDVSPTNTTPGEYQKTTLPNGVRVVSVETYTPSSVVGLVIQAGSRYEGSLPYGTAHTLARLAYKSTDRTTSFRRTVDIEAQTSKFQAVAQREQLRYVGELPRGNISDFVTTTLTDTLSPTIHEYEIDEIAETIIEDSHNASPKTRVLSAFFREAFDDRTLGRPIIPCPYWGLPTDSDLHQFVASTFKPSRVAFVGVGVNHQELVDQALKAYFPTAQESSGPKEEAQYVGGRIRIASPHTKSLVAVGFGGKGIKGSQLLVLSKLLNPKGGSPFTEVFSDASVAGFIVDNANQEAALAHLRSLEKVSDDAIQKAIKSALFETHTTLETRVGTFDLLAGHAFIDHLPSRQNVIDSVKNVAVQDIKKSLKDLLSSKPTIASIGRSDNIIRTIF